jgi:hypothetical protein
MFENLLLVIGRAPRDDQQSALAKAFVGFAAHACEATLDRPANDRCLRRHPGAATDARQRHPPLDQHGIDAASAPA